MHTFFLVIITLYFDQNTHLYVLTKCTFISIFDDTEGTSNNILMKAYAVDIYVTIKNKR